MHVVRAQDWIVILSVMGSCIALYVAAGFILIRPFLVPEKIRPKLGTTGIMVLVLTALSLVCLAYASFVEPYWLELKYVKIPLADFPENQKPIRIVQVSDMHCDKTKRLEDRVASEIERIKPSLILFSGDSVNSLEGQANFNEFAEKLRKVARTFAVKGDWDFAFPTTDVLKESKLEVLTGYQIVKVNGVAICLSGADSGSSGKSALHNAPKGIPTIVMYHNPDADIVMDKDTEGVDLYICGHTHGGQIALPFYGALITQSKQGKTYESGLHKLNDMWIYTNRGIGMEGHFPRLRFCSRPELTIFELCSNKSTN